MMYIFSFIIVIFSASWEGREVFWACFLPKFPLFFTVSRGFFVGVFPGLRVSLAGVMNSSQFCFLGSVGLQ